MTATFFALAFLSAVNPKLLGVDLLLIDNERPRRMFACFLAGGIDVGVTIGLLDAFVLHADTLSAQGSASAGLDLAIGVPLVIIGVLLATGHGRRKKQPVPAGPDGGQQPKKEGWAQRVLREPGPAWPCSSARCAGRPAPSTSPPCTT
jgi:hypothetical protein